MPNSSTIPVRRAFVPDDDVHVRKRQRTAVPDKAGAPGIEMNPAEVRGIADPVGIPLCVYCGDINEPGAQMLVCADCGNSACFGGPMSCISKKVDVDFHPMAYKCPCCSRLAKKTLDYNVSQSAAHYAAFATSAFPLILVTAHEPRPEYFTTLIKTQFQQEYNLLNAMYYSYDIPLTVRGWENIQTITAQARMWQAGKKHLSPMLLLSIECHSDPDTGFVTFRCNTNTRALNSPVNRVAALLLGDIWNELPKMLGLRGLVIGACGYVVTNAQHEAMLRTLVAENRFNFVLSFLTTGLVVQTAGALLLAFLRKVYMQKVSVEAAALESFLHDRVFMLTVGLHLTWADNGGQLQQYAYSQGTASRAWGIDFVCPNPSCPGSTADVRPRIHKRASKVSPTFKFRCQSCKKVSVDYVKMPDWVSVVDESRLVFRYPMLVNGAPASCYLIGKVDMVDWAPGAKVADALDVD